MLSVRLLTLDHYLSKPIPELFSNYDNNGKLSSVPVLRIFGPTVSGEKACVHIHGVYPYLYVPYEGGENPDRDALLLAAGLDRALQTSNAQSERFRSSCQRYVHRVRLVSGIPIYGYHSRPRQFFKVYFFNPYSIRKAAELLLSGAILNMKLQPHETHIPFTQQFMIDFNLFGMSMVNFKRVMYRQNPAAPESLAAVDRGNILPSTVKRTSHCLVEVDVLAEDILNRVEDKSAAANPGLAGIWEEERTRRRLKGRLSEPTQPNSDPRPPHAPHGVEVDFLRDLKGRLLKISNEEEEMTPLSDFKTPYPAELPENSTMLEASILEASPADEELELYKSKADLVNEKILLELSQRPAVTEDAAEGESSDSEDEHIGLGKEGRGEGADPEGEGAELDMTQPLSPPAGWTAVSEKPGESSSESEEEFWREMADHVMQLDGAGDSDSDPRFPQHCSPASDQPSMLTQHSSPETLSHLPNNVLSFLDDHCLDLPNPQPMWDIDTWSPWAYSPLPELLTPASNVDPANDCLLESLHDAAPDTPDSSTSVPQIVNTLEGTNSSNPDMWADLKNMIGSRTDNARSLTLREYLKGDIIHVDFKVINGKEMVVIEYSPHEKQNSVQYPNKFLIKPLYEFIEDWNKAEISKKVENMQRPKYINGFTPVKKKKLVSKKLQPNRQIDKECQTTSHPNEFNTNSDFIAEDNNVSYSINESVISKKKIVLKLVTSQSTFQESNNHESISGEQPADNATSTLEPVCESSPKSKERSTSCSLLSSELQIQQLNHCKNATLTSSSTDTHHLILKKEPEIINVQDELVRNVNDKFEEYYQRLIGKKKVSSEPSVKVEHRVIQVDSSTDCDTETGYSSNFHKPRDAKKKCMKSRKRCSRKQCSVNPIDFVSQIISNYSKLPKTSSMPPMSIIVNIGDPNVPVQVKVQSSRSYFDGANDSSSDDSSERNPKRKRTKYRPLEVLVQQSPVRTRRRKKDGSPSSCSSQSEGYFNPKSKPLPSKKRNVSSPSCSSAGEPPSNTATKEDLQTSESFETKDQKLRRSVRHAQKLATLSNTLKMNRTDEEFITGSDDDGKLVNKRVKNIPQTDTLASSSDDQAKQRKKHEKAGLKSTSPVSEKLVLQPDPIIELTNAIPSQPYSASTIVEESFNSFKLFSETSIPDDLASAEKITSQNSDDTMIDSVKPTSLFVNLKGENCQKRIFVYNVVPPTKTDILNSLNECPVLEKTGIAPHYSNLKDATKHIEVGNKVLKLNHPFAKLKPHYSSMPICGIEEFRKSVLNGQDLPKVALIKNNLIVLTPALLPPTRQEVLNSSKNSEKLTEVLTPKVKMLAPAGDDSNSGDETMSLTPCTPSILSDNSPSCTPIALDISPKINVPSKVAETGTTPRLSQRRVSFDDASIVTHSTPTSRRRGSVQTPEEEEGRSRRIDPLGRFKSKRRLLLNKLKDNRRMSTDSNKSTDIFDNDKIADENEIMRYEKSPKVAASSSAESKNKSCQIQGVSLNNTFGFKTSLQNFQDAKPNHNFQFTTLLAIEILTETRGDMLPDPELDSIVAIFYGLVRDYPEDQCASNQFGIFTVGSPMTGAGVNIKTENFADERSLLEHLVVSVRLWDPDFIAGYEIEKSSWGYVVQRAYAIGVNMLPQLGRTLKEEKEVEIANNEEDADGVPRMIRHLRIPGRVILNVWRLLRHEVALTSYSFENIMFHLLHERHPQLSARLLAKLWQYRHPNVRFIPAEYCMNRVKGVCRILGQLDLVSRNSELAKVFGIQFEEVLSRGSQFRVESMMLRLAKPSNFVSVSPDVQQRAHMRAPGSLPLIMEPESCFYADPVIVLDFQSLYPSMIIAHNYCFSTCLGRVTHLGRGPEPFEFGCTRLSIPPDDLAELADGSMHVSPAGVAFVRSDVRKGILPSMLEEILETRLMVKKSMKENKGDKLLQKVLHARQLGLKLIANVTYGYTAANFSGRMPCIEVGDSVVSKGRETLQRAIRLVQSTSRWGARVVYGDTDSLFVLTPGRTRQQAFQIGEEIANAVTQDNPRPVKLKLEKVYQPCILQTKKRYVGYMYESADQMNPVYEAKGIETVRRDGCPATAKILQKALHILFDTGNVSLVKKYTLQQFAKIFQGRVNIQDLIFAKEYRGRRGYRPGACVPALQLAKQWTSVDRRAEPRNKERVPYVIVHGAPGVPLIRLVRSPRDLLADSSLRIHAAYYITKAIIPPLQRCFGLIGADPLAWYAQMPRRYHRMVRSGLSRADKRATSTISQYLASLECVVCGRLSQERVCPSCLSRPHQLMALLTTKIRKWERAQQSVLDICRSCCQRDSYLNCISMDCPVLYRKHQINNDALQVPILRNICQNNIQY